MKEVFEIRIHGRAGQGAKSAAQMIAETALDEGKHIQAFPEYGPERMGAPMTAYVRISEKPITIHQPVTMPDVVIVIDPFFVDQFDVVSGLDKKGVLIVNTTKDKKYVREKTGFDGKIYTLDATRIALDTIKANKPNTPLIGALIKVTNIIKIDTLKGRIKEHFLKKLGEEKTNANIKAIKCGYDEVK